MTEIVNLLSLLEATTDDDDSRLAGRLRGVLDVVETVPHEAPPAADVGVRYVAQSGDDTNDGFSWDTAKRTGYEAITSLPTNAFGSHVGAVRFGVGQFSETVPWPVDQKLTLRGEGAGVDAGTTILRSHAGSILAPSDGYTNMAHGVSISGLSFHGNWGKFPTPDPLVQVNRGGFNFVLHNVSFVHHTGGVAFDVIGDPLNVQLDNVTFANCGAAINVMSGHYNEGWLLDGSNTSFAWWGGQVDDCGDYPVTITTEDRDRPDNTMYSFRDVKFEGRDYSHTAGIRLVSNGNRSPIIRVDNVWGLTWPASPNKKYLCYEEGPGVGGRWVIGPASVSPNDEEVFISDIKATDSGGRKTILLQEIF